ncbi:sensor protein kinase WalK [Arthrobacter sp. Hiyo4]|nr:sensor protein kinase WalK [Arthrobacter sp. Hiyo4]
MSAVVTTWPERIRTWLPSGEGLSDVLWARRHRAMLWALWLHIPVLAVIGILAGTTPSHIVIEVGLLAVGAALSSFPTLSRRTRMILSVLTLMSCSAVLIHFTDGLIESHFHFFAAVAFITLYQEWLPFVLTLSYVVFHHGVVGLLFPHAVYNHAAAGNAPVLWGLVHGGFIILASLLSLISWRLAETERANLRLAEIARNQLASIVEASPDLALVGHTDGSVMWMNPGGRKMLGLNESLPATELKISSIFAPAELKRIYAEDMPALERDGTWQGERQLQAMDGTPIPVQVTSHLHQAQTVGDSYVTEVMRDLRPQLKQERTLRLSENRLSTAEGVARLGSWEWDLGTNKISWTRGMYLLHGMAPGDGNEDVDAWLATVRPEDRERALASAMRTLDEVNGIDFVYKGHRADGSEMVVHSRGELVIDEGGRRSTVVGTLLDITDQHASLEAVQRSEELGRRILESAGEAYLQFRGDGVVTEWNVQAENTFGWSRQEALGQSVGSLVASPEHRETVERLFRLRSEGSADQAPAEHFEHLLRRRDGSDFPAEVSAWTTNDGARLVYSSVVRDVSERYAAERAKDEFVSVVGHELRTPLTSIHGALGLLRAGLLGSLNERGRQMVEIAAHNTDRLVRLINDILDIERLNSGKVALELRECDIAVLAERTREVMRAMAETAGVFLVLDVESAEVWADPDRIEQTLTNLVSNAIKFSPAGAQVRLMIRGDRHGVTIQVRDQGRGIPPEDLERIFERFQQVDATDSRDKGGTGLGLAICRTIAEQHGGRIWAENAPGGGAVFTVTLPGAPASAACEEPAGPKVLIFGEHSSVRGTIRDMLLPHGYCPIEVTESTQLSRAAVEHRPSVILIEQQRPDVSGWDAVIALQDNPETKDIPVVFLSFDGDKIVAESEGLVLDEPLDLDGLLVAVEEAIGRSDAGPKLLLVEDDEGLAAVLTERFRQLGIEVHHAPTARQALALCAHIVPDLVVLDLQLPDQDGYAVVAQLRRDARLRGVPLAVYSARDLTEADRKRLRLGKTGFFTKGRVTPDEFERHVVNLLGRLTQTAEEPSHD